MVLENQMCSTGRTPKIGGILDTDLLQMVVSHHPQALSEAIDGETLVLRLDDGRMGLLNGVGGWMWNLMDGSRSLGEIARACADEYEVELTRAEADAIRYAQRLLDRAMIVLEYKSS
jgi:hypothetical protein